MRMLRGAMARRRAHLAAQEAAELGVTRAAESLLGPCDVASTLCEVATSARSALGADRASCYAVWQGARVSAVHTTEADPRRRALIESARGGSPDQVPLWRRQLAGTDPVLTEEDVARAPRPRRRAVLAEALGVRAYLGARIEHPLLRDAVGPVVLGTLLCTYVEPRRFSAHDLSVAHGLANLAALTLAGREMPRGE